MTSSVPGASTDDVPSSLPQLPASRLVILGVAASDSHAVANHLIAYALRSHGFTVVNLGTCTPVAEFADACVRHPETEALIIGSLNGQIHEDLHDLAEKRNAGLITCPVIVGGNLSVGSTKHASAVQRLYRLGVDHVLNHPDELFPLLDELRYAKVAHGLAPRVAS